VELLNIRSTYTYDKNFFSHPPFTHREYQYHTIARLFFKGKLGELSLPPRTTRNESAGLVWPLFRRRNKKLRKSKAHGANRSGSLVRGLANPRWRYRYYWKIVERERAIARAWVNHRTMPGCFRTRDARDVGHSGEFSRMLWTQPLVNRRLLLAGSPVAAGRFRNYNGLWKGGPGVVGWLLRGGGGKREFASVQPAERSMTGADKLCFISRDVIFIKAAGRCLLLQLYRARYFARYYRPVVCVCVCVCLHTSRRRYRVSTRLFTDTQMHTE